MNEDECCHCGTGRVNHHWSTLIDHVPQTVASCEPCYKIRGVGRYEPWTTAEYRICKPEKPKDRTGLVQIGKDGVITGWKFTDGEG